MKRVKRIFAILLSVILVSQFPVFANSTSGSSAPSLNLIGCFGGLINTVAAKGTYVYIGQGSAISITERTDEGYKFTGSKLDMPAKVTDLKIEGNILYAAVSRSGIYIFDICDPYKPVQKGFYKTTGLNEAISIKNSVIYLSDGIDGLKIVDAADPGKPFLSGQAFRGKSTLGLSVYGGMAYIASPNEGLLIADISQSNVPKELYTIKTPGNAMDVAISGNYAYVADDHKGLTVIDIKAHVCIKSAEASGRVSGITLNGDYLYASDAEKGLRIFDIKNPSEPLQVTSLNPENEGISDVIINGGTAYCIDMDKGILCCDISNPSDLNPIDCINAAFPYKSVGIAVQNQYIYSIDEKSGLSVIDAKDPQNPSEAAHLAIADDAVLMRINGQYLYLCSQDYLYTVSIANPAKPTLISRLLIDNDGVPSGIDIDKDYLYIACGNILQAFSLKTPSEPVLVKSFLLSSSSDPFDAADVNVRDGIAYISGGCQGIWIYDVSDLNNIKKLGVYSNTDRYYANIDFSGTLAFAIVPDAHWVEVLNITDISKPTLKGIIKDVSLDGTRYKAGVYGYFALLPDSSGGILIADLSSPDLNKIIGRIPVSGVPETIDVQGDKAYILDNLGVISILGITGHISSPPEQAKNPKPAGNEKIAYLTIDDGPSRNTTPKILDILKSYGIHATFFVLPRNGADDIYQRILDEGHVIGNHSYSHDYGYLYGSVDKFRSDILKARSFISNKLGYTTSVFRFPGGSMGRNKDMIKDRISVLNELGYTYFDWNVSTADTDANLKKYGDEDFVVKLLANNVIKNAGSRKKLVVLMHDSSDKIYTVKALPKIIEGLKEQGYRFDVLTND